MVGIDSWITALVVGLVVAGTVTRRLPVLLFVFLAGLARRRADQRDDDPSA